MAVGLTNKESHKEQVGKLQTKDAIKKKDVKATSDVLDSEIFCHQHYRSKTKLARSKNWTNLGRGTAG